MLKKRLPCDGRVRREHVWCAIRLACPCSRLEAFSIAPCYLHMIASMLQRSPCSCKQCCCSFGGAHYVQIADRIVFAAAVQCLVSCKIYFKYK